MSHTSAVLRGLLTLVLASTLVLAAGPVGAQTELPTVDSDFGPYEPVPLLGDEASYAGPATPTSLDGVGVIVHLAARPA